MEIDKKIILKLIDSLEQLKKSVKNLGEEISQNDIDKEEELIDQSVITSPIVGTAYLAPEPGAKKFVEIGKKRNNHRYFCKR